MLAMTVIVSEVAMNARAIISVSLIQALSACKGSPPKVFVAQDQSVQLTASQAWMEDLELNDVARLQVSRRASELYAVVIVEPRKDLEGSDVEDYSELTRSRLIASMQNVTETAPVRVTIHGHPAVQVELHGLSNKIGMAMLHTSMATRSSFLQVMAWTTEARWQANRAVLQAVVESVRVPGEAPGTGWTEQDLTPSSPTELVSQDGALSMTVPAKWKSDKDLNDEAALVASRIGVAAFAMVLEDKKTDFPGMDVEEVSRLVRNDFANGLKDAKQVPAGTPTINGNRAVRYRIEGDSEGESMVVLHATVQTPTRFLHIFTWAPRYRFDREAVALESIINSVRELHPVQKGRGGRQR